MPKVSYFFLKVKRASDHKAKRARLSSYTDALVAAAEFLGDDIPDEFIIVAVY